MIVLEVPHQLPPHCFEARDFAHLTEIAEACSRNFGRTVWEQTTPLALLLEYDLEIKDAILYATARRDEARLAIYDSKVLLQVADLADRHGWEAKIYRADYWRKEGQYYALEGDPEVLHEEAVKAAIAHDLHACRIFATRKDAVEALIADEAGSRMVLPDHNRIASRAALRQILGEDYYGHEEA